MASHSSRKIAYLVHDLNDAAVRRRVGLFETAGHVVTVAGFHRDPHVPGRISTARVVSIGQTADGALARRVLTILRRAAIPGELAPVVAGADVVVARNLETLVLAARLVKPGQRLVYECLDIHRLLLGSGLASGLLHRIEAWALRRVDLTIVSAPAFRDAYFRDWIGHAGPVLLVENLVPFSTNGPPPVIVPPPPPPLVIGLFGMLRCRRSFDMLKALAASSGGRIEIVIAGRPSNDQFDDFAADVAAAPGVSFLGGYTPQDLPHLFGRIHFIWAIDYFEDGLNSAWLLPNRLYEGLVHGAVPLALRAVATGAWLAQHRAGVLLDDPAAELPPLLERMTMAEYDQLRAAVAQVPLANVAMDDARAQAFADAITGVA